MLGMGILISGPVILLFLWGVGYLILSIFKWFNGPKE